MRENRPSGSEGGATELNRSLLPLSNAHTPALSEPETTRGPPQPHATGLCYRCPFGT
jgi:hypothetical protein